MTASVPDALPSSAELQPLLERMLDMARAQGATQAEASLSHSRGFSVNVRESEVESLEFQRDRDLGITVYFGQRKGNASTSDLSEEGLRNTLRAACAIAANTEEDPCAGLADAQRMATHFPDLSLDHPWDLSPDAAIELARACEAAALAVDPRIQQSEGAGISTQRGVSAYANSHGFYGYRRGTQHSLSCSVIAADDEGAMQRDYWYDAARHPERLASAEAIGRKAGERTVARLGGRRIATGTYPVLYVPEVARSLFGHLISAISGNALYRRASFLLDQLDTPVFPAFVQLRQQPFLPEGMASATYDQEGVATRERQLIENGVLRGWLLGSYSARKLGLETTGNAGGVFNLEVTPNAGDLASLMQQMGSGLLVTELMGQGANTVTGDYSRGASGFWIEGGEIRHPVEGITIAGNLREMYRGISAIGSDVDTRSSVRCGSVLLDQMMVAGEDE
jgi:PmbA protein